jgi:hypothetical protein
MIQKLFGTEDGIAMDVVWSLEHLSNRYLALLRLDTLRCYFNIVDDIICRSTLSILLFPLIVI